MEYLFWFFQQYHILWIFIKELLRGGIDAALYLCFFPKVISGPIVLWKNFQEEIQHRIITIDSIFDGICDIAIGLVKKVVIADYFGTVIQNVQSNSGANMDIQTAWLITFLYMLEIYYDFAGYSNIAIGLSRFMGIKIKNNFCFPYISTSISEFWRRWHISLGQWFKTYVYIPLGGNRKGRNRTLFNLFFVMLISGIWHGAGIAYMLWGIVHGLCIVFERIVANKKWYLKTPAFLKWLMTMFIVMIGWEVFRLRTFTNFIDFVKILFGIKRATNITFTFEYYLTKKLIITGIISVLGGTILEKLVNIEFVKKWKDTKTYGITVGVCVLCMLVVVMICITNSTYSPFIYFQY